MVKAPEFYAMDFPGTVSVETLRGNISLQIAAARYDDHKPAAQGWESLMPKSQQEQQGHERHF